MSSFSSTFRTFFTVSGNDICSSGSIPIPFNFVLFGVKYSSDVIFNPLPSGNVNNCWITPLPYVFSPIIVALPWSFNAPASISDELAVFPFVSTTIGIFIIGSFVDFSTVSLSFLSTSYRITSSLFNI